MKKATFGFLLIPLLFASCARYNATSLTNLPCDVVCETKPQNGLIIAAKAFSKAECKQYLDRDVLKKGYQPVQLYIENTTEVAYFFSLGRLGLPAAPPEEVAKKVHTSTVGRIVGYGAAAVIATPLFAIPAIVDGYKSVKANDNLDQDFLCKAAKDQLIFPHSHVNMIVFVPKESYQEIFSVTLLEEVTHKPVKIVVHARS